MTTTKALLDGLLQSGEKDTSCGKEQIRTTFADYNVTTYAVLIDHTTVQSDLPIFEDVSFCGLFTFNANLANRSFSGREIKLLKTTDVPPETDAWVIASTSRAASFDLIELLSGTGNEGQIIVRLYKGQITQMSAYMDVFSGKTETLVYINHYFDRKYRVLFPIDLRFMFRKLDGETVRSGQCIIKPGGNIVFDTRQMDLGDFKGYLYIEAEVENLQVRVQPFLHFWADYISDEGMCRNHQSGWSPWPAGTFFNRGFLPTNNNLEAVASVYNDNDGEVIPSIFLHYSENGTKKIEEKALDPVKPKQMALYNISEEFPHLSMENISSAYYLMSFDKPVHRPNGYVKYKGTFQMVDTFHQSGGKCCYKSIPAYGYTKIDIDKLHNMGMRLWQFGIPLLDRSFGVDSFFGLLSPTICDLNKFEILVYNEEKELLLSEESCFDENSKQFINLNKYILDKGIVISSGTVFIVPKRGLKQVPRGSVCLGAFKHKNFHHFATTFMGGTKNANLPFYVNRRFPFSREYDYSSLQTTDKFAPGTVSDEFNSLYVLKNHSLKEDYSRTCHYRLDIIDSEGRQYSLHREIKPQYHDTFWLSDILKKLNISSNNAHYTLWVKSYDAKILGYHMLYRKKDHALSCDDISDGTLQTDPQIGGIKNIDRKLLNSFIGKKIDSIIPSNVKEKAKKIIKGQIGA